MRMSSLSKSVRAVLPAEVSSVKEIVLSGRFCQASKARRTAVFSALVSMSSEPLAWITNVTLLLAQRN